MFMNISFPVRPSDVQGTHSFFLGPVALLLCHAKESTHSHHITCSKLFLLLLYIWGMALFIVELSFLCFCWGKLTYVFVTVSLISSSFLILPILIFFFKTILPSLWNYCFQVCYTTAALGLTQTLPGLVPLFIASFEVIFLFFFFPHFLSFSQH
jgi:hypothetical protein